MALRTGRKLNLFRTRPTRVGADSNACKPAIQRQNEEKAGGECQDAEGRQGRGGWQDFGLHFKKTYMNMKSCSYYESANGSKRLRYLAWRDVGTALRRAAPPTPWRLEGDADSVCGNAPAYRLACAAFVRSGRTARIRMASWGYSAAAAYPFARSFFQRVFPGGVSEYVSAGGGRFWRLDALVLRGGVDWGELKTAETRMRMQTINLKIYLRMELTMDLR